MLSKKAHLGNSLGKERPRMSISRLQPQILSQANQKKERVAREPMIRSVVALALILGASKRLSLRKSSTRARISRLWREARVLMPAKLRRFIMVIKLCHQKIPYQFK